MRTAGAAARSTVRYRLPPVFSEGFGWTIAALSAAGAGPGGQSPVFYLMSLAVGLGLNP